MNNAAQMTRVLQASGPAVDAQGPSVNCLHSGHQKLVVVS